MADEEIIKDDLMLLLAKQQEIQNEIANAIREGKESVIIDFGQEIVLTIKPAKLLDDSIDSNEYIERYGFSSDDKSITGNATKDKTGKIEVDVDFNNIRINERSDEKRRKQRKIDASIKKHRVDKNDQEALRQEIEVGLKKGNVIKMDIDREFSSSENMDMFIKRAFKINPQEVYRVQGDNPHDFKYIAKTGNSKEPYVEIPLSSHREGHNSRQKIWILENGQLREKTVDSLMLKGNYGIATDVPDNSTKDHTRTYLVSRTHNGRYLAIAAEEKSGVNRSLKRDDTAKDFSQRSKSLWEIEDIIESALLAERIGALIKDKKLSTKEVELVKELKIDNNMNDEEVIDTINAVSVLKKYGYNERQIQKVLKSFREIPDDKKVDKMIDGAERKEQSSAKTMSDGHEDEERILGPKNGHP